MTKPVPFRTRMPGEATPPSVAGPLAAMAFLLLAGPVFADGGFFVKHVGRADSVASSVKQEALIVRDGDKVQVTLRTHFRSGPPELAWVIPVPKKPDKVEKAEESLFLALRGETTPQFWGVERRSHFACGCGGEKAARLGGSVSVLESGTVGVFNYTVLSTTGADPLVKWLVQNGYTMPSGADRILKPYADQGWYWLAVQLRPEEKGDRSLVPHPIRYTYHDAGKLVYPLIISRLSADPESEVLLYVLSDRRFECENWWNFEVPQKDLVFEKTSPSHTNYETLFREAIRKDGGHAFATEFAQEIRASAPLWPLLSKITGDDPSERRPSAEKGVFMTRLRTVIAPETMDRDVVLAPSNWESVSNMHHVRVVDSEGDISGAVGILAVVSLMLLGLLLFRRRRHEA